MPFKSRSQQRFMYLKHPVIAKRWQEETPEGKKLPEKVKARKSKSVKVKSQPPLGSGQRFKNLSAKLQHQGVSNPDAVAAWIGRKKYGPVKFQKLSSRGRKRK